MTATALKVKSTPMAPYIGLIERMNRHDLQIVMTYIREVMDRAEEPKTAEKDNAEIIREKYKNLRISPEIQRLRGCLKLTDAEKQDERTQYILGL